MGNESVELDILGLIHDTHAVTELVQDAIVGSGEREILGSLFAVGTEGSVGLPFLSAQATSQRTTFRRLQPFLYVAMAMLIFLPNYSARQAGTSVAGRLALQVILLSVNNHGLPVYGVRIHGYF
jgi:hypothetical protein